MFHKLHGFNASTIAKLNSVKIEIFLEFIDSGFLNQCVSFVVDMLLFCKTIHNRTRKS